MNQQQNIPESATENSLFGYNKSMSGWLEVHELAVGSPWVSNKKSMQQFKIHELKPEKGKSDIQT